ncbi:MAG TPA: c-type cytochrome [Burkholderiales bacterium]|nr:c-type cytochrome [Burkholderiales bacterium]
MKARIAAAAMMVLAIAACQREERRFQEPPGAGAMPSAVKLTDLHPGGSAPQPQLAAVYLENAYAISQGKQLFDWFNCSGCHNRGGGGMGPALMDDKWIYGADPANIYATIVEGRPNGMPSFRGRIPDPQVWQLVAYVRSMSGLAPSAAAPGRNDAMQSVSPEATRDPQQPKVNSVPKASEH